MTAPLLSLRGVKAFYGNVLALKGVDLDVHEGEIVTLIGANGAGKSTLMMTVFGNPRAHDGSISFDGRDITRCRRTRSPSSASRNRPKAAAIFPRMTVLENLQIGATVTDAGSFRGRPRARLRAVPAARRARRTSAAARCRAASSRCWRSGAR